MIKCQPQAETETEHRQHKLTINGEVKQNSLDMTHRVSLEPLASLASLASEPRLAVTAVTAWLAWSPGLTWLSSQPRIS